MSWEDFKTSNQTPEYLAAAWCWQYERPSTQYANLPYRQESARYWYEKLQNIDPNAPLPDPPPQPPEPEAKKGMPIWYTIHPQIITI